MCLCVYVRVTMLFFNSIHKLIADLVLTWSLEKGEKNNFSFYTETYNSETVG